MDLPVTAFHSKINHIATKIITNTSEIFFLQVLRKVKVLLRPKKKIFFGFGFQNYVNYDTN